MLFPWSNHHAQAVAHRAAPASVRTTEEAVAWSADLVRQGTEARVVSVQDLTGMVTRGSGTEWARAAKTAQEAAIAHREAADILYDVLAQLDSAWQGGGADAAAVSARRFGRTVETTESTFARNCLNITEADHAFQNLRTQLAHLGPRPEKNLFDTLSFWDTDTEKAITAYNGKAAQYLERYHAYAAHLDDQARALRYDWGTEEPEGATASSARPARGPLGTRGAAATAGASTGHPPGAPGAAASPGASPSAVPGVVPGAAGAQLGAAPVPDGADPHVAAGPPSPAGASSAGTTSATGYVVTGTPASPATPQWPGGTAASAPPPSGTPSPGFGGAFRGTLPGGPAGAARGGASGVREGVRGGGRPSSPGSTARSRREDDRVHERKYVLDDGSLFTDDERYALVDPETGLTTVDPTIGA
ncbi:hypothetical protein VA596_26285 [Amycolatopsis sp., V23-08]|uniref:PPE domain-containing protein n=1 Tax=Amycolatopsis heterodermiae TaxID=3110235 RepID=A0ABU5R9Z7_9PSEU|nr:hypothetical protein [Amycolatopsis sp., V23-08]MEA5363067.1 hypothetical protein [Amycolatopsis sp., V23-08]